MKRTAFLTRILSLLGTVTAFTLTQQEVEAGGKHEDVSILTYTDFGQNKGRYAVGTSMNALLTHIRTNVDKGVVIHYTDGTAPYTIPNSQGMISFVGTVDIGAAVAIAPNMIATVAHNGDIDASFTERVVGSEHAVNYAAVGVRYSYTAKSGEVVFRLVPEQSGGYYDYCIQRQSKIITDTTWNPLTTLTNEEIANLRGSYLYHSGSGSQSVWSEKEGKIWQTGAYAYIIGAINNINSSPMWDDYKNFSLMEDPGYGNGVGASVTNPIPNAIAGGDSGSPVFIYNAATGQYEYIAAQQSGGGNSFGQARGNVTYTQEAMKKFNVAPSMASGTVYLNAITTAGEYYEDSAGHSTRTWYGYATDAEGNILSQYTGVRSGLNTWADLSAVKDRYNWYAYDANAYIQQSDVDLFFSSNLVFNAEQAANTIVLNDTVDLGVGYAEFNAGKLENASFTITSAAGEGNLFNHAGYVINEGAEVHLQLTNPEDYMTEWRKNGAGDLYIDGTGNTNALLSVGGSGTTYLQQQGGWAAYNVLASAGATVVIGDLTQIARDMTIGANGGTLDMNGHSMDWYMNNTDVSAAGFSINVLTEQGFITNTKAGTTTTLTFQESGEQTFLGSFTDTADAALKVDYQGGGTWKLHSIHTKLSHADSGLSVSNGHVILSGTLTEHGKGSETGTNQNRVVRENDWHYADAQMNVDVAGGATFELGSHARLTGNVTVAVDGTFILREGVHDRYEYVEGGSLLEDTYQYEQFYGLHGNVSLAGDMLVEYSEGTTTNTTLTGKLSGAGSLTVKAGTTGGTLTLAGDNSELTGVRQIVSGGVIATTNAGLGNVGESQWLIGKQGWLASHGFTEGSNILSYISTASEGTLALSNDLTGQLNLTNHQNLFIGAEVGKTVQYGAERTNDTLTAYDGKWNLGGGGGELVVNFKLTGNSELVLGADTSSSGVVNLVNSGNDFTGAITFVGTGITLGGYLGQAELTLSYGNALLATDIAVLNNLTPDSAGMLLVNNVGSGGIDLSGHTSLNMAAQAGTEAILSGDITLASGATHYLGAQDNATLVVSSLLAGDIVIDAQGHTGGRVEFTGNNDADSAATLDGDVTIQGHRNSAAGGSITLGFRKETEIAGTVTLNMGGTLDLSGVSITVDGNLTGNGGSVQDSVGGGTLIFDTTNGDTTSDADVAAQTIRKIGNGTLTLAGTNEYSLFYVDGGTLRLGSETAASRYGTFYLADGTTLDYGTYSTSVSSYSVSNSIVMNRKGKATLAQTGMSASGVTAIGGNIQLSSGTELEFTGAGSYSLGGSTFGGSGSVLSLSAAGLNLTSAGTVNMIGTLAVNNVSRLHSTAEGENKARNIAHLELRNGATLTLDETTGTNSWVVNNLSGTGNIYWDSSTNVYDSSDVAGSASSLVLKGTGDFSGNIALNRHASNASYTHGAYLELASEKVAQNATVTLTGAENGIATMALNAATVSLAGLEGNEYAHTYAGSHSDTVYTGGAAPASTRATTLSLNTASGASYTYAGSIGHSSDAANGISLVKTGAGSQSFTGTAYVDDVTVSQGTLSFTGGSATVRGDVSVAYGSALTGVDFNLSSGKTFTVAGSDTAGTATFGGALTLGAGTLIFDGSGIPTEASGGVALTLGNLNFDSSVASYNITFINTAGLVANTYTLATGNWSSVLNKLSASGISAYDTSFSTNASGHLLLRLTLKSGAVVWDGNDDAHYWDTSTFGSSAQALGASSIAVFDDSASNTLVQIWADVSAASASFLNAAKDYTIANYGGTATVSNLDKNGTGKVTIQSGLKVTDTTTISHGELEVTSPTVALGTVTGEGTLTINWSGTGSYTLSNLNNLNIKAGQYGSSSDPALDVRNITVHTGATYTQGTGVTYGGHIIGEGGTIALTFGGLNGQMTINRDTYLNVFKGTTVSLNTLLIQNNGAALIQTGSGTVAITAAGRTDLENYIVRGGTLTYNGGANHTGQGTISVENGATLKVAWGAGLEAEQINLAGGATLRLENGASGWGLSNHLYADIMVESGAIISGSSTGDNSNINGSISGSGTLNLSNTTGANTYTINSVITDGSAGALGLNLVYTYVTLTGANTYSGGTVVDANSSITTTNVRSLGSGAVQNDGILSLGAALTAGGLSGSGTVNTNGQVLTLTNNADYTYTGTVSGQGGILQTGIGSSSFTGGVDVSAIGVSAGSLSFTGNTTTISSGGVVSDGASLTLGGNITLGGMIENSGTVSLSDGIVFNLSLSDFTDGVFTLISGDAGHIVYNDADFGAANFQLGAFTLEDFTTGGVTYEITRSETELSLTLQGYGRDLTWSYSDTTSIDDPIWDGTNQYWVDEEGQETAFRILDNVTFGPNDGNQGIAMATAVEVGDMTVQGIYTFKQNPLTVHGHFLVESSGIVRFYVKPDTLGDTATVDGQLYINFNGEWTQNVDASAGSVTKQESGTLTWNPENGKLQIKNFNIKGELGTNAALQTENMILDAGSVLKLNGTASSSIGTMQSSAAIYDSGSLAMQSSGTLQLGSTEGKSKLLSLSLLGGTTNVVGAVGISGSSSAVGGELKAAAGQLSIGKATLNINEGGALTVNQFTAGNEADGNSSVININGGELTITGSTGGDTNSASFLLAHWKSLSTVLTLNSGTLTAENTTMHMGWDSGATFKAMGGTANLKGVLFSTERNNSADHFFLGSATAGSASLNLGASGIAGIGSNDEVKFGEGTVRAVADTVNISGQTGASIELVGTKTGTIFDTNGHTITIDSTLTGSGNLVKTGSGTLNINGAGSTLTGAVTVQAGTLAINPDIALASGALGNVTLHRDAILSHTGLSVGEGASLHITGSEDATATATLTGALTLGGGTFSFDASVLDSETAALTVGGGTSLSGITSQTITLANYENLELNKSYYLISGIGSLTTENFTLGALAEGYSGSLSVQNGGLWLTMSSMGSTTIVWNGTDEARSWTADAFGSYSASVLDGTAAIFDDTAANRNVLVGAASAPQGMVFNNTEGNDYVFTPTNLNTSKISTTSLELNGGGAVEIYTQLAADSVAVNAGTLLLNGQATLAQDAPLSIASGAELNITGTSQTFSNLTLASGATISSYEGTGELTLVKKDGQTMDLAGTIDVGTVSTQGDISLIAGANMHTLNVQSGSATLTGDNTPATVTLAADTSFTREGGYTLGTGSTLSVLGSGAQVLSDTTLAGGTLWFANDVLSADAAPLTFSGALSLAEEGSVNVALEDISALSSGGTWQLATGDWSGFTAEDFTMTGAYADLASFSISGNTLSMTLAAHGVWAGTDKQFSWNTSSFGPDAALPTAAMAIFDDTAANKNVSLTESVSVGSLRFNHSLAYTITGAEGAAITSAASMTKLGSGALTVNADLNIGGDVTLSGGNVTFGGATTVAGTTTQSTGIVTIAGAASSFGYYDLNGGTLNVTGAGSSLGLIDANGHINFQTTKATVGGISVNAGVTIQFLKPEGAASAAYDIHNDNYDAVLNFATWHATGSRILVAEGTTLTVDRINSAWGWGNFVIDGDVVVRNTMNLSSGSRNPITGKGSLTTNYLNLTNNGTYVFDLPAVTVKNQLSVGWNGKGVLQSGVLTSEKKTTQTSSSFTVQGGTLNLAGTSEFTGGTLALTSGKIAVTGGTATISNTFNMNGGTLELSGGTTTISGSNVTASGGAIVIDGGTLKPAAAAASALLGGTDSLTLSSGTLDLSAVGFTTTADSAITLKDGASFSFGANGTISLGNLAANTTYQIFNLGTDSALDGWVGLNAGNFTLNGTAMTNLTRAQVTLGATGTFFYTSEARDLTWTGAVGSEWNKSDANWVYGDSDTASEFVNGDRVTFASDATVSVPQVVHTPSLTVNEGVRVTLSGESVTATSLVMNAGSALLGSIHIGSAAGLTLNGSAELGALYLDNGGNMTLSPAQGETYTIGSLGNVSTLTVQGKGTLNLGDASLTNLDFTHLSGSWGEELGELNLEGTVSISDSLRVGKGTLTIGAKASVTTEQFIGATQGQGSTSVVNIDGGSLTITGEEAGDDEHNIAFLLAHWNRASTTINLNSGSLTSENSVMYMGWDSSGIFKALGGEATLSGIRFSTVKTSDVDRFELGSAMSGTAIVNIGSAGITGMGTSDVVQLGHGTLKAAESFSITGSNAISMVATASETLPGTIIDTNGKTITVEIAVSGSGAMVKRGAGTLAFTAASTGYTGSVALEAGTLQVDATSASLLEGASALTLTGGVLDLSFIDSSDAALTLAQGATFTFTDGGVIALGALQEDVTYTIFDVATHGATLTGWNADTLSAANFTLDGNALAEGATLVLNAAAGTFMYTTTGAEQYWDGGVTGVWDTVTANWDGTGNGQANDNKIFTNDLDAVFASSILGVTVAEAISVNKLTVKSGVQLPLVVADGGTLTVNGSLVLEDSAQLITMLPIALNGTLNLAENSQWVVSANQSLTGTQLQSVTAEGATIEVAEEFTLSISDAVAGYTGGKISGAGTVEFTLTNDTNTLNLGESFTGETYVKGGTLGTNNAHVGTTLRLADGVTLVAQVGDVSANVVLEGDTALSGNAALKFQGTVTGDGTLIHSNNGYYEYHGEVNLGGLKHDTANAWGRDMFFENATITTVDLMGGQLGFQKNSTIETLTLGANTNFVGFGWTGGNSDTDWEDAAHAISTGTHTIGTASIAGGKVYFNGATTIDSASISGGTITFNGATTIGTASMTGGTVKFGNGGTAITTANVTSGTVTLANSDTYNAETATTSTISTLAVSGGTLNVAASGVDLGDITLGAATLNFVGTVAQADSITITNNATLSFGKAADATTAVYSIAGRMNASDNGTNAWARTISVAEGVTLKAASLTNNWGIKSLTVDGVLDIQASYNSSAAEAGKLYFHSGAHGSDETNYNLIAGAGSITADTVQFSNWGNYNISVAELTARNQLNFVTSGTTRITDGIITSLKSTSQTTGTVNVNGGTLKLGGNATFSGGSLTLSGGTLEITGGTTGITNTVTATGGEVKVNGGKLVLNATTAAALIGNGADVTVGKGGTLDLSAISFGSGEDTTNTIAISSGSLAFSTGSAIALGNNVVADTVYNVFSATADTLTGWNAETLSADQVYLGSVKLSDAYRVESVSFGETGTFSFSLAGAEDLYWAAGATGTWDTTAANWDATPATLGDDPVHFYRNDNVFFTTDAAVTATQAISAGTLAVQNNATVALSGSISADSMSVESGELSLSGDGISAGAYTVAQGATLKRAASGADALAATILTTATGAGDISISGAGKDTTTVKLTPGAVSAATGELILSNLTLDMYNASSISGTFDLSSFTSMSWDNVAVKYWGQSTTFNDVTIGSGGASLRVQDMNGFDKLITFAGTTTLNGTLDLGSQQWKTQVKIEALTGTGDLKISSSTSSQSDPVVVTIASGAGYTGDVTVTKNVKDATLALTCDTFGAQDSTITLAGGNLQLTSGSNQTLHSGLVVNEDASLTNTTLNSASLLERTLGAVEIADGETLTLWTTPSGTAASSAKAAVKWTVAGLSGAGTLKWDSWSYHDNYSSQLVLAGDGSGFTGEVYLDRRFDASAGTHQTYVVLASENAVKNATVRLKGNKANGTASLAVDTENAYVGGLQTEAGEGNIHHVHLYAGAAPSAHNAGKQASTASNTLTITGAGGTFAGTVGTAAETEHLNLTMTGAGGTQTFSGEAHVGDITVNAGTLVLSNAASTVSGDVTVHAGGSLTLAAITLGTGQTLSVLTGTAGTVSVGALTLSGGELTFDASLLKTDAAALGLTGALTMTEGVTYTVNVGAGSALTASGSYKLATGDWSAAGAEGISFTVTGLEYGSTGTINATADGLFLNYSVSTIYTWTGSAGDNAWGTANWDTTPGDDTDADIEFADAADTIAVFRSDASVNAVDAVTVGTVSILDGAQVTLGMSGEGASFTAGEVVVQNGKLTIANNTNMTGISSITVAETGVLELGYGATINNADNAVDILLQGGAINLRNGAGTHNTLHADITVDEAGTIAGSLFGGATTVSGSITGTGTLTFAKDFVDNGTNPMTVSSTITDGAEGSLGLHVVDTNVVLSGTNTYTGGTIIDAGGKLTITNAQAIGGSANDVGQVLGTLSGDGTLVIDLEDSESCVIGKGTGDAANLGAFAGTIDVQSGILRVGRPENNINLSGENADFNAVKVIVGADGQFVAHFGQNLKTLETRFELQNGAIWHNFDGHVNFMGDIAFNVNADGTTNADGTVQINSYWGKNLKFEGLLSGAGTVKLENNQATAWDTEVHYYLLNEGNTFSGVYELADGTESATTKTITLYLGAQNAAQYATINLASTTAVSKLQLDSDATIAALNSTDADNLVTTSGAYTLTVSSGSFAGKLENGTGALSLTKQGNGTLTLSGVNTYTGATTISGGTLELAGAVSMAAESAISLASGTTLLLNATNTTAMVLGNAITGTGTTTIHKKGSNETVLSGNVDVATINVKDGTNQATNAGTLTLTGATVTANTLYAAYGQVNVGAETDGNTFMVVDKVELGDSETAGSSIGLAVRNGSTLSVTGSNNGTGGGWNPHKNASLLMSEWGADGTLDVQGKLLVPNANVSLGDRTSTININGGTMAVAGIADVRANVAPSGLTLNLSNDGKLILGSNGITTNSTSTGITLGAGTVGMSAATTTIAEDLTLNNATTGTTFDTTQYSFVTNEAGVATDIVRGETAGTMTLSGNISGGTAKMNVVGNGELNVTGAATLAYLDVASGATATFAGGVSAPEVKEEDIPFKTPVWVSGAGKLNLRAGENAVDAILTMDDFSGRFTVANSANLTANITVAGTNGTAPTLEITEDILDASLTLNINEGATLVADVAGNNTVNIAELQVSNNSGFKVTGGTEDSTGTSTFNITLLASEDAQDVMNIVTLENASNDFTVFNVDNASADHFMGDIVIKGNQVAMNLDYPEEQGGGMVPNWYTLIEFNRENATTTGEQQVLGVVSYTFLKGIKGGDASSIIVSGHVANKTPEFTSAEEDTTMNFGWGSGADVVYESGATIKNNLNLVKQGSGKQVFTGDTSEFDGSVQVDVGELAFGTSSLKTADTTVGSGDATLSYGRDTTYEDGRVTVISNNGDSASLGAAQFSYDADADMVTISSHTPAEGQEKETITATNSLITIAQGAGLTVDSMIISDSSRISGTPAAATFAARSAGSVSELALTDSTVVLGAGNDSVVGDTTPQTLSSLQPMGGNGEALTLSGTSNVLTITSNALSALAVTGGSDFLVDFSYLLTITSLEDVDFIRLDFNNVAISTENVSMTGLLTSATGAQFYLTSYFTGGDVPSVGSVYFDVRSIPEPTTTTLSVLALAGLMLRRRRK